MNQVQSSPPSRPVAHFSGRSGFTLIELLVVIAIIALLVSILAPSLASARRSGQAVKCMANLHHVGQAMAAYLTDSSGVFPVAYAYPNDAWGNYDLMNQEQVNDHPHGYVHWSYFLYNNGQAPKEAFMCPSMKNGGSPRTNPGSSDWEVGQVDQNGAGGPNPLEDKQSPRIAYGGNAGIFPRNKFTNTMSNGPRINRFVNEKEINSGRTILVAEFNDNWKLLGIDEGGGILSKSHRSINPFWSATSGSDEYGTDPQFSAFTYRPDANYGLRKQSDAAVGWIDQPGVSEVNAVGRHHPGGDKWGGTANFLYADGHAERRTILSTLKGAEWGNKYHAITGDNRVAN